MVAVSVSDDDVRHGLAAHRIEQCRDMRLIHRTRIDDRHAALPDDITDRALESEWAWIVAQDAPNAGHDLLNGVGRKVETLVVWNVFAHCRAHDRSRELSQRVSGRHSSPEILN